MKRKRTSGRWLRAWCFVLSMVLVAGMLSGCSVRAIGLAAAATKSLNAYKEAAESLALPDMKGFAENGAVSEELSISIMGLPVEPMLEGFGLRLSAESDYQNEKLGLRIEPLYGEKSLIAPVICLDGSCLALNIPEITGETSYKFDLKQLGKFLYELDVIPYELRSLGVDLFELSRIFKANAAQTGVSEAYKDMCKEHLKRIGIEGPAKTALEVNGYDLDCQVYTLLIPNSVLVEQLDALIAMDSSADELTLLEELFRAAGLSEDLIETALEEIRYEYEYQAAETEEIWEELRDFVRQLGNVEIQVGVNGGYVVCLRTVLDIYDEPLTLSIELGGGENYVDDLSISLMDEYAEGLHIAYTGNHNCANGPYEDECRFYFVMEDALIPIMETYTSYEPDASGGDLLWSFLMDDGYEEYAVETRARLNFDDKGFAIENGRLVVDIDAENIFDLALDLRVEGYTDTTGIDLSRAVDVTTMSLPEIVEEILAYEDALEIWLFGLIGVLGDNADYLI